MPMWTLAKHVDTRQASDLEMAKTGGADLSTRESLLLNKGLMSIIQFKPLAQILDYLLSSISLR
jgi:hypothetical protein